MWSSNKDQEPTDRLTDGERADSHSNIMTHTDGETDRQMDGQ